jgi:hypothetical protein
VERGSLPTWRMEYMYRDDNEREVLLLDFFVVDVWGFVTCLVAWEENTKKGKGV